MSLFSLSCNVRRLVLPLCGMVLVACSRAEQTAPSDTQSTHAAKKIPLLLGSYSKAGSKGLYTVEFDTQSRGFSSPVLVVETDNPSYAAISSNDTVYAVNETGEGALSSFHVQDHHQTFIKTSSKSVQGGSPCYVSLHPKERYVATANYMGGSISVFGVNKKGEMTGEPIVKRHQGKGPNKQRQEAPHAHWVRWHPDGSAIYAVDLGIDKIMRYPFDANTGVVGDAQVALTLSPGDGPRHMVFHPALSMAFVLNELSNTVVAAAVDDKGHLTEKQRLLTLPESFNGATKAAHIALNQSGDRLYISNRGHNSIAVFEVSKSGELSLMQLEPTQGDHPRHFLILEDAHTLLVANQHSESIVPFAIQADGRLKPQGTPLKQPQVTYIGRFNEW